VIVDHKERFDAIMVEYARHHRMGKLREMAELLPQALSLLIDMIEDARVVNGRTVQPKASAASPAVPTPTLVPAAAPKTTTKTTKRRVTKKVA
jgi:hypothetical protein